MKTGKISNSILKRSVLKRIDKPAEDDGILSGRPAVGQDCGILLPKVCCAQEPEGCMQTGGYPHIVSSTDCGIHPVFTAANNLAAAGAVPQAVQCCILLPESAQEQVLKEIIDRLNAECRQLGMQILGGHTQVEAAVSRPLVTVTAIGYRSPAIDICSANAEPGQDIILTKWIGIGGIREMIRHSRKAVEERYSMDVIERAQGTDMELSVLSEAQLAAKHGVTAMHDVSQGGIFAALWDMAEASNIGMEINFRAIPVCQEIIEICEMFEINPYELESTGCLLMTSRNGCDIVEILNTQGIPAAVIGRTTAGNARVIHNLEEVRFLDTPKEDEIYRFLKMRESESIQ